MKGRAYKERLVPVHSTEHYFRHFGVVELDFIFYTPLLNADGKPTGSFKTLEEYTDHAPPEARFFLKAPQAFTARILRKSQGGKTTCEENPTYLNVEGYVRQFYDPARELLGDRLAGLIFEQEYQRVGGSQPVKEFVGNLDRFFRSIPGDVQHHLEIRSPHLLKEPYFAWLETCGLGFVYSHWSFLPALREQWQLSGGRFTAADGNVVVRLLTPLEMRYDDAYESAFPFDKPAPGLSETGGAKRMVLDTTALVFQGMRHDVMVNVITNNRAWGSAPDLAQTVARRVLQEEARRAGVPSADTRRAEPY